MGSVNKPIRTHFQPDYLISWDVSSSDYPCIDVIRLSKDENGNRVVADVIAVFQEKTGVVSLRQILDQFEFEKRAEEKRAKECSDFLKKNLNVKTDEG